MQENRETSEAPVGNRSRTAGAGSGRKARMNASEESESGIVPMNHSNGIEPSMAGSGEGRPLIKENIHQSSTRPTQSGARVSQGLAGVRKAADRQLRDVWLHPQSQVRDVMGRIRGWVCHEAALRVMSPSRALVLPCPLTSQRRSSSG